MVRLTDTTLRDAHQSLIATRMRTRDMLPIVEKLDEVGFYSLEVWGGATFDAAMRFLNEDPWDRLVAIRERVRRTPLQMLLRGQNLVGYRHYADDVVVEFIRLAVRNGIDIFRIFDALNDVRNLEVAIKAAKDMGAHVQGAICYTVSPVHTIDIFVEMAIKLQDLGCDSICIKDMAGLITPRAAYDLVRAVKEEVKVPVDLHTHCTSGMGPLSYVSACQAGVDILDTAFSPFSGGTSQPACETIVAALQGTEFDTGLDLRKLVDIGYYFNGLREKYKGLISPVAERSDVMVLLHQIPGGMISNLYSQLEKQKAIHRYDEVLQEIPRVREDLGFPPLVTPTSQIVGTQALLNVLTGERYKEVTKEVRDYCLGYYGKTSAPISSEVMSKVIGDGHPIAVRPADLLPPELEKARLEAKSLGIGDRDENIVTYALYPEVAGRFFRGEIQEEPLPAPVARDLEESGRQALPVMEFVVGVDGEEFQVYIRPSGGISIKEEKRIRPIELPQGAVVSPVGGMVLSLKVKEGDWVNKGEVVAVIEAMKMQFSVNSDYTGRVRQVFAYEGEVIDAGDVLVVVE